MVNLHLPTQTVVTLIQREQTKRFRVETKEYKETIATNSV